MSEHTYRLDLTEAWMPIPGWPYEASNLGRVRRVSTGKVLRTTARGHCRNYRSVDLFSCGIRRTFFVHSLVALAFLGTRPEGHQVNHKNGVGSDNRLANLEYVTPSENHQHAYALGLRKPTAGILSGMAKLSEQDVRAIRARYAGGESQRHIAAMYGIGRATVGEIVRRSTWAHVGEEQPA